MSGLVLALLIASFILAAIAQFIARGTSLVAWAVLLTDLALLWPRLT